MSSHRLTSVTWATGQLRVVRSGNRQFEEWQHCIKVEWPCVCYQEDDLPRCQLPTSPGTLFHCLTSSCGKLKVEPAVSTLLPRPYPQVSPTVPCTSLDICSLWRCVPESSPSSVRRRSFGSSCCPCCHPRPPLQPALLVLSYHRCFVVSASDITLSSSGVVVLFQLPLLPESSAVEHLLRLEAVVAVSSPCHRCWRVVRALLMFPHSNTNPLLCCLSSASLASVLFVYQWRFAVLPSGKEIRTRRRDVYNSLSYLINVKLIRVQINELIVTSLWLK